ncbi:MAG: N-acetylglucosamine-6-phosphate deacetylase [Oscillospiraceae bacterium]|nr:N-acetylglucosamine-6-phosphate deacetylase [Oscillospiraceae bacterium]
MRIRNAETYNSSKKCFIRADLEIEDGKFAEIINTGSKKPAEAKIIPGFIDIHSHGAAGVDIFGANSGALVEMSAYYAQNGVTTLFLATMSERHDKIMRMIEETKKARPGAKIDFRGIHVEGPYINKNKRGAHNPEYIREPNMAELDEMMAAILDCGLAMHMTVAPELDGAFEFMEAAIKKGATISMGHTEASGEILKKAAELGAKSYTHLFNGMAPMHHRNAGVAGYALIGGTYAEIICDGIHLCPEFVSLTEKAKGIDKIILVSDSMAAAGLPDGSYNLGSDDGVKVENGKAFMTNPDGTETIAGSTTNLSKELENFVKFTGRSVQSSLLTVTKNPAECVGIYDRKGSIETGKDADFIVLGGKNEIKEVYAKGEKIF